MGYWSQHSVTYFVGDATLYLLMSFGRGSSCKRGNSLWSLGGGPKKIACWVDLRVEPHEGTTTTWALLAILPSTESQDREYEHILPRGLRIQGFCINFC